MKSLIDNPKELLELIDSCLKPKQEEKKKYGEVFTPFKLINEMLDKLPKKVWKNKNYKWFDPANGMGNFPIAIYLRLMKGLKEEIEDENDRKKHILENMLYMSELNKKNVYICKQIFNINDEYKLNLYNGDSLKLDIEKEWGIKKFDVIVGNPPYNNELKRTGATALYHKFIEKYIDKTTRLTFIIPSRWFSGGKGLDGFRKMMLKRTDIEFIKHFDDASKLFSNNVDIKGGVNYFMINKKYKGKCKFNNNFVDLSKYDVLVDSKYYNLIDTCLKYDSITKLYMNQNYYGLQTNDKRLNDNNEFIKCYVSKQKGFIKYIDKKYITKDYKFYKIITARASYEHKSGFGNMFIDNADSVFTKSYISFKIKNDKEAKSLLSYLKCKLPNVILSLRKNSQDISENTCKWIPLLPLDREWTNKKIYEYLKLKDDEIQFINDIKIIGYK